MSAISDYIFYSHCHACFYFLYRICGSHSIRRVSLRSPECDSTSDLYIRCRYRDRVLSMFPIPFPTTGDMSFLSSYLEII